MSASAWDAPAPELAAASNPNAAGISREALENLARSMGQPAFRGGQLFEGIYVHRWTAWEAFSNLPKAFRAELKAQVDLAWPVVSESQRSEDGATKHAFRLADGRTVEGVFMPYLNRTTLCLSSQVGCAMGCTFCATGQMGIQRNLSAAEIVGQVMAMLIHHAVPPETRVNLVFMGMGEPLHNLDHVMEAFQILTHPAGLALSPRRITVSTSGLVPGITRMAAFKRRPRLALSLNGTTDAYRSKIMPVNKVWNLKALAAALGAFPLEKGERITLEYVLLQGVTDSLEDGRRLAAFAQRFPSKVNLIPFNPHEGSGFAPPAEARVSELCDILASHKIAVSVRRSRGQDVAGACGQLAREAEGRPARAPGRPT